MDLTQMKLNFIPTWAGTGALHNMAFSFTNLNEAHKAILIYEKVPVCLDIQLAIVSY